MQGNDGQQENFPLNALLVIRPKNAEFLDNSHKLLLTMQVTFLFIWQKNRNITMNARFL